MPLDAEHLRTLARAAQARDEEKAEREVAQFEFERLGAFFEWLEAELERKARDGLQAVTLRFSTSPLVYDPHSDKPLNSKMAFNEPNRHGESWYAFLKNVYLFSDHVFWVGPDSLPIERVVGFVTESAQKAGITAVTEGISASTCDLVLSW